MLRYFLILLAVVLTATLSFLGWIHYKAADHGPETVLFRGNTLPIMPDTLRLISWNIGYAGLGEGMDFFYDGGQGVRAGQHATDSALAAILDFITQGSRARFYLLQEVDAGSRRSWGQPQARRLQELLPGYSAYFAVNYDVAFVPSPLRSPMGKVKSGLLSLSDYQPAEALRLALPGRHPWPTRMFMPDRCLLLLRYPLVGGKMLTLINVHNSAFDDSGAQRAEQVAFIRRLLEAEYRLGNYVIAGGDWNQSPQGYDSSLTVNGDLALAARPVLPDNTLPGWTRAFDPTLPTNRYLDEPYVKGRTRTTLIDFFLLSPNLQLLEVRTHDLGFRWSDHQPVEVAVMFSDQP